MFKFTKASIILFLVIILFFIGCEPEKKNDAVQNAIPETVTVKIDELRVRSGPNTMTSEVGMVHYNAQLEVIKRSPEMIQMGDMKAHWYQIRTKDGLFGWVYGAYLDVELQIKDSAKKNEEKKEKIRNMIKGRWYVLDQKNQITHWFIRINPEKKEFIAGYQNKVYQVEKYEETIKGNFIYITQKGKSKPVFKDIKGELRGHSFILKAMHQSQPKKFAQTSKRI